MLNFTEFNKLQSLLKESNVPFKIYDSFIGSGKVLKVELPMTKLSAAYHNFSYGNKLGLLEIKNGLTVDELEKDIIRGFLTAEEVAKRFIYCYKNKTTVYRQK